MFEKMKGMLFKAAIVACFQLVLAAQSGGLDQTDFSGTWILNSDKSDTVSPGGMGGVAAWTAVAAWGVRAARV